MANANARINIDINTSAAAAGLRNLQSQITAFNSTLTKSSAVQATAMRNGTQNLLELVNASRFFTAETVKMQTAASALDKTLSKGQVTIGQFFSAKFRKDSLAAAQVMSLANTRAQALQTQFVATGAAANGMRDAIAIRPLQAFNDAAVVSAQKLAIHRAMLQQATTQMINFGKNTQWAGRQLMVGFTVPLTIFGGIAGKTFRELEREAVNFKKVYGDAFTPPAEMEENLAAVQELAKEYTKYGIAVKDTIGLAAQAAAAGAQNKDLLDATAQATRLSTLGQMEQNQALETTISLQNAFKLSGDELAKSINFLNMVENQTVVTLQDLSAAIPRVAPVIKGLGGSVEDLAAFMAALQEGGVTAEQGANALKSGLASLINPTDRAVEKLDSLGISLNSIIQMNRGDLMGTVQDFAAALDTLDEFTRQQALEQVFGKFQYARLGALFANINKDGTQAARVLEMTGMSAAEMAASAEKELSAIEEAVGTKFTASMERLKLAIAPIGELFTKMAIPVLNFFGSIIEKFNQLPDFAKNFLGLSTVIVGIVIPAGTMFLGLLMNLIGTLVKFGSLVGIAFKGFTSGGIKGAFDAVTQAIGYMSLAEMDAVNSAQQLGISAEAVNRAFLEQVTASDGAQAAIMELAYAYEVLTQQMLDAAVANELAFSVGVGAMGEAAGTTRARGPRVRRNRGGTIPGSGNTDTVPAMLTPGEFVVNKQATKDNLSLLRAINDGGKVPGYFSGGMVARLLSMFRGRSVTNTRSALGFITPKPSERQEQLRLRNLGTTDTSLPVGGQLAHQRSQQTRDLQDVQRMHLRESPKITTVEELRNIPGYSSTDGKYRIAEALIESGIPVDGMTGDWISYPKELNQAARRNSNTPMTTRDAAQFLRNTNDVSFLFTNAKGETYRSVFPDLYPGVSEKEFSTRLARRLRLISIQEGTSEQFVTDALIARARDLEFPRLRNPHLEITGIRLPTKGDLARLTRTGLRARSPGIEDAINEMFMQRGSSLTLNPPGVGRAGTTLVFGEYEQKVAGTAGEFGRRVRMSSGGVVIPGIRGYMAGARVNPLFKEMERRRAAVAVAKGKRIDDIIFARGSDKKLNASAFDLLTLLKHNPNLTRKELERIQKYHGKRIRDGVFGRFDSQFGVRFRDSDSPTWRDVASLLDEKGFPVIQKRNQGGQIFESGGRTIVPGVGNTDTVPAMLTPGEFVVNKKATQSNMDFLKAINDGKVKGYAAGDIVQPIKGNFFAEGYKGQQFGPFASKRQAQQIIRNMGISKNIVRGTTSADRVSSGGMGRRGMMGGKAMGLSMLGTTAMMGGMMIPGVSTNTALSSGIMGGGMLLSMAPMLAGMGPFGIALAGVTAAAAALGAGLMALRKNIDESVRKAAEFGANLGGVANRMEEVTAATGYQFARDRQALESFKFTPGEAEAASQFSSYFESETGQKFVEDLQKLDPQARYEEVRSAIALAIADGMDKETAKAYGDAIAFYTNDALLKSRIGKDLASGKFAKGSSAAIIEIEKRVDAAVERLGPIIAPGEASRSYLSDMLGTGGMTNIVGEAALSTIPFLRGIHETINDITEDGFQVGDLLRNLNPVAMFGTSISTFANLGKEISLLGKSAESVAAQMGSSIQILKEVENAEALLLEERRNGIITTEQYNARLTELQNIEQAQYERMGAAIRASSDEGFTNQAISDQLILAGLSGDLAKTIANATNKNAVAQKMFNESFEQLSEEQKNVVTSAISRTLTGITPENAQAKIAEIENTYAVIAEQLVNAAKDGLGLTAKELDAEVLRQQISNFVQSAFEDVDMPRAEAATRRRLATENLAQVDTLGLTMQDITGALGSFMNTDFALNIASSKQQLNEFIPLLKELQEFPGINIEILTKTEEGRDPEDVAKDIKKTLKDISKFKFKGIRQEIVQALPSAEKYISLARQAGIDFKNIPKSFEDATIQANELSKAFDPKRTGALKNIDVKVAMNILGADVDNPQALISALQSAFPDGLDPVFLPLLLQVANPEILNALQGQYGSIVAEAIAAGNAEVEIPVAAGTSFARRKIINLTPTLGLNQIDTPGFPQGDKDKDGGGGGGQKSIVEQLKDQFKSLKDVYTSIKQFIDSKTGEFKAIAAGPFGPQFIEFLKSQGEEGIKILKGSKEKLKQVYDDFRKVQMQEATNFAQAFPANLIRQRENIQFRSMFERRLEGAGFNADQSQAFIEGIGGEETIREYEKINRKKQKGKKLSEDEKNLINEINRAIRQGGPAADRLFASMGKKDATDNLKNMKKELELVNKIIGLGFTKEEAQELISLGVNASMAAEDIKNLGNSLKEYNNQLLASDPKALAQELRDLSIEINDIQREIAEIKIIQPLQEQLEAQQKILNANERSIELKQREIEGINRSIELKRREIEPIDEAIKKYEDQIDKIQESYDIQLQALDDVADAEERLNNIREGRLDVASALSRGDVAGAARAAIEMRRRFAEQQQDATRQALEKRRQQEIDIVQGNIKQKQEERVLIEEEIKNLELDQRKIQDEIYQIQQDMIPVQDEIYRLNELIVSKADELDDQYSNAANQLINLQNQLDVLIAKQKELNSLAASYSGGGGGGGGGGDSAPATVTNAPDFVPAGTPAAMVPVVQSYIDRGIPSGEFSIFAAATARRAMGGPIKKYAMGGMVNYKGSREPAPGFMMGGRIKKMAFGSFVPGRGMTDKVPAMLTPGEFVVRKPVAEKFGPMLQSLNSQIFPGMGTPTKRSMSVSAPQFDVMKRMSSDNVKFGVPQNLNTYLYPTTNNFVTQSNTDVSPTNYNVGPTNVQYTYNLNISTETDASPDDIANTVMYRIKRFEDRRIKGTEIG